MGNQNSAGYHHQQYGQLALSESEMISQLDKKVGEFKQTTDTLRTVQTLSGVQKSVLAYQLTEAREYLSWVGLSMGKRVKIDPQQTRQQPRSPQHPQRQPASYAHNIEQPKVPFELKPQIEKIMPRSPQGGQGPPSKPAQNAGAQAQPGDARKEQGQGSPTGPAGSQPSVGKLREENDVLRVQISSLQDEMDRLQTVLKESEDERKHLVMRLSKLAGDMLRVDNPAIADLSDQNRPTKLAEMYTELYDNQWTDAFEELTQYGYTDIEAIETLKMTLKNTFEYCQKKSVSLIEKISDAVNFLFIEYKDTETKMVMARHFSVHISPVGKRPLAIEPDDYVLPLRWQPKEAFERCFTPGTLKQSLQRVHVEDKLKKLRKEVAESLAPMVQKAYLKACWDKECLPSLKPFIKQCIFITWMMVVQGPPLCFHDYGLPGSPYDGAKYRHYTHSGSHLDYVIWPALLLHENGPLLCKGTAQSRDNN